MSEVFYLRILERKALELLLNGLRFALFYLYFLHLNLLLRKRVKHARFFAWTKENERVTLAFVSCSAPNPVDIRLCILWRVDLKHPIYGREIESSRS